MFWWRGPIQLNDYRLLNSVVIFPELALYESNCRLLSPQAFIQGKLQGVPSDFGLIIIPETSNPSSQLFRYACGNLVIWLGLPSEQVRS